MNRKQVAKGKLVRRFGINVFEVPKYDKILARRKNKPGMHGARRTKITEFGRQLTEKQKLKFAYGISERQFRTIFERAKALPGITGNNMLELLERRLDNVVFRAGFAVSRTQARQMVSHGQIYVNGRRLNIASARLRENDEIVVKNNERAKKLVRSNIEANQREVSSWLERNEDKLSIKVKYHPKREDIPTIADEQVVVEFFSK